VSIVDPSLREVQRCTPIALLCRLCEPSGMADAPTAPPKSRFAWFGTFKGAIALVAALLGIVATSITIVRAFSSGDEETPSFESSVTTRDQARSFVSFLTDHDNEVVYLDARCGPVAQLERADAGCAFDVGPELVADPGEEDGVAVLEVFTQRTCPAPDERPRCPGTYWVVFVVGEDDDQQVDNGPFGAGGLVAKGQFKSLLRGARGSTPRNVEVIELRAASG
jgi:hypothetical protein